MPTQDSGLRPAPPGAQAPLGKRQPREGRRAPATGRARLLGPLAVPLVLAGCAAAAAPAPAAAPAAVTATTSASTGTPSSAAAPDDGNTPPAAAQMVCSDEIRRGVTDALGVDSVPTPRSTWAGGVYTCTYLPPQGPVVLSVTVAPTNAAAGDQLAAMRDQLGVTAPEPGLGQQAFSADNGTVLALKDNMVLHVDATALPDDLGVVHERRIDLARVLAAEVFNCWTGND